MLKIQNKFYTTIDTLSFADFSCLKITTSICRPDNSFILRNCQQIYVNSYLIRRPNLYSDSIFFNNFWIEAIQTRLHPFLVPISCMNWVYQSRSLKEKKTALILDGLQPFNQISKTPICNMDFSHIHLIHSPFLLQSTIFWAQLLKSASA